MSEAASTVLKSTAITVDGEGYTVAEMSNETTLVYRGADIAPANRIHPMSPVRAKVLAAYRAS